MKRSYYVFTLLIIGAMFTSCKKDNMAHRSSFDKSYESWLNFKKSSGNSYRYMITTGSWTGASSQSIITVKEGRVVQRSYMSQYIDRETNKPVVAETWQEDESNLNEHTPGAAAMTLDEIYHKAKTEWLIKKENTESYFEANNDGMISACGYRDKNCVDDCFRGITIKYIEAI